MTCVTAARVALAALASLVCGAPAVAGGQVVPDSLARPPEVTQEYDARTDSTTRRVSAYAIVDTSRTPPDTFAVELRQAWRGRGATPPVGAVDVGIGRTRAEGLRGGRSFLGRSAREAAVTFVVDGGRRIRLEQGEYATGGGRVPTFETAWYRISAADLRRVAEARELRLRIGERELWIASAWRHVAAEVVASQGTSR